MKKPKRVKSEGGGRTLLDKGKKREKGSPVQREKHQVDRGNRCEQDQKGRKGRGGENRCDRRSRHLTDDSVENQERKGFVGGGGKKKSLCISSRRCSSEGKGIQKVWGKRGEGGKDVVGLAGEETSPPPLPLPRFSILQLAGEKRKGGGEMATREEILLTVSVLSLGCGQNTEVKKGFLLVTKGALLSLWERGKKKGNVILFIIRRKREYPLLCLPIRRHEGVGNWQHEEGGSRGGKKVAPPLIAHERGKKGDSINY